MSRKEYVIIFKIWIHKILASYDRLSFFTWQRLWLLIKFLYKKNGKNPADGVRINISVCITIGVWKGIVLL